MFCGKPAGPQVGAGHSRFSARAVLLACCSLGCGAVALASLLALRNLRLKRVQGLVGGAADGTDQGGRALHHRVQVVPHETLLRLDERRRVRQAEQLLRWRGAWIATSNFSGLANIKNVFGVRICIVHTAMNTI